jgi:hypothetical protein
MAFDQPDLTLPRLADAPAAAPRRRWRGLLRITDGSAAPTTIAFTLDLDLNAGGVAGAGATRNGEPVALKGWRGGGAVGFTLDIGFAAKPAAFACNGEVSADEDAINGSAALPCLFPDSCACFGQRGGVLLVCEPAA